jgi:diguanylate cyclase (GGDEF)-like protein
MQPFLLFYLGIDRFQPINEVLGHTTGDEVLAMVGRRLTGLIDGRGEAAHIGGSVFALLCPNPDRAINALGMARSIHSCLEQPLQLQQLSVDAEASIGIASSPDHGRSAEELLRHAQIAMQAARDKQIMIAVYDDDLDYYRLEHLTLASELRRAIDADELVVHYQPKIDIASQRIIGVEALIRWQHPQRGMIPPDMFIPMAEETGIIHPFTAWLINEVCRQLRSWQDQGIDLTAAINLAPRNLLEADLPEQLQQAFARWRIRPDQMMMEITERGLISEQQRAMQNLHALHDLGIAISIDDFGTGYSSLAYLKDLPVDELKIDKSFIDSMQSDARSLTIVQMVIQMGHYLGFEVIAEGVESASEWQRLELLSCDRAQGFYMGRPMPSQQLEQWLAESPWGIATST